MPIDDERRAFHFGKVLSAEVVFRLHGSSAVRSDIIPSSVEEAIRLSEAALRSREKCQQGKGRPAKMSRKGIVLDWRDDTTACCSAYQLSPSELGLVESGEQWLVELEKLKELEAIDSEVGPTRLKAAAEYSKQEERPSYN